MTNPTKTRRRFTAQQRQEAVELCLSEGLSCTAVAQRLGLPNSSLAKWVRQARIALGSPGERKKLLRDALRLTLWRATGTTGVWSVMPSTNPSIPPSAP